MKKKSKEPELPDLPEADEDLENLDLEDETTELEESEFLNDSEEKEAFDELEDSEESEDSVETDASNEKYEEEDELTADAVKEFDFDESFALYDEVLAASRPRRASREKYQARFESESRLNWLVTDFSGITTSVYEAVMVAAHRARQIGRRQKQQIDAFNNEVEATELVNVEDDTPEEPGIDHFHHIKPTVHALKELKEGKVAFYYPEEREK